MSVDCSSSDARAVVERKHGRLLAVARSPRILVAGAAGLSVAAAVVANRDADTGSILVAGQAEVADASGPGLAFGGINSGPEAEESATAGVVDSGRRPANGAVAPVGCSVAADIGCTAWKGH